MENQWKHTTETKRNALLKLLQNFEGFFDVTLGTWKIDPEDFKWKEYANPVCSIPYPVQKAHAVMLKKYFEHLFLLGLIEGAKNSKWVYPSFVQPKSKTNRVCFLSDFRNLNKPLKRKPYPMPNTNEMLLKLEGFQYAMSLDLNM